MLGSSVIPRGLQVEPDGGWEQVCRSFTGGCERGWNCIGSAAGANNSLPIHTREDSKQQTADGRPGFSTPWPS